MTVSITATPDEIIESTYVAQRALGNSDGCIQIYVHPVTLTVTTKSNPTDILEMYWLQMKILKLEKELEKLKKP